MARQVAQNFSFSAKPFETGQGDFLILPRLDFCIPDTEKMDCGSFANVATR